jgi:hypothetical protein
MALDTTKFASSTDGDLLPAPYVDSISYQPNGNMYIVLDDTLPATRGPLIILPASEKELDARLERINGGAFERRAPGGHEADTLFPLLGARWTASSGWYGDSAINARYMAGPVSRIEIQDTGDGTGTWTVEIATPYAWWDLDLAEFIFAWVRFYTTAGAGALPYLDRDQMIEFSEAMQSDLNGARFWAWRRVDWTIGKAVRDLARQGRHMLGWGGYQAGSSVVQQLGLRPLFLDELERWDLTVDLEVGRDSFLVAEPDLRTADELICNQHWTRWFGAARLVDQLKGGYGDPDVTTVTLEESAELIEQNNEWEDEDTDSIENRGVRRAENEAPRFFDRQLASTVHRPHLWITPPRVVRFPMGPLHQDFDTGAVIKASSTPLGLAGTEELLVVRKTVNRANWTSEIEAVELPETKFPSMNPGAVSDPDLDSDIDCVCWCEADVGVSLVSGDVDSWLDISGNSNSPTFTGRGGASRPYYGEGPGDLNGEDTVNFAIYGGGTIRALDFTGVLGAAEFPSAGNFTLMFLANNYAFDLSENFLLSWERGSIYNQSGVGLGGSSGGRFLLEADTVSFDPVSHGEFYRGGTILTDDWRIIVVQSRNAGNFNTRVTLHTIDSDLRVEKKLDLDEDELTSIQRTAFNPGGDISLGADSAATGGCWRGSLAALAFFRGELQSKHIMGVARWWAEKWGPF